MSSEIFREESKQNKKVDMVESSEQVGVKLTIDQSLKVRSI